MDAISLWALLLPTASDAKDEIVLFIHTHLSKILIFKTPIKSHFHFVFSNAYCWKSEYIAQATLCWC